ncbi:hypothetical protein PFICI_11088 [Pestalotiopsis fici W106-1]|uniref:Zn(2)-C6 fungal-type domain-containing protein n=1 Tax=Pestalotiopsis fici (strain W106-1 / CGMCC3.15140) TaxID=1229662 RepID=W3WTT8_PESFW|nr:uncharacterized protein PFICI_11088 [Pestalotiopsis fici W106-1]ETS77214.1 hypothetical protein PFICI_11088 [Pestalotiopsis fici W106-1]
MRTSQRRSLACVECTKRKVKCDKQVPCSRCSRLQLQCYREKVRLKRSVLQHESQIDFLNEIITDLETSAQQLVLSTTIGKLKARVQLLQFGDEQISQGSREGTPIAPVSETLPAQTHEPESNPRAVHHEGDPSLITALEHLAWGRVSRNCFPHRTCRCEHRKLALPGVHISQEMGLPFVPDNQDARSLIQFHLQHLAWHHNCLHGPTFSEQCENFWISGVVDHPLWLALYFSVLSATVFAIQNSQKSKNLVELGDDLPQAQELFSSMTNVLFRFQFLSDLNIYSAQAIAISTEVAHNLGQSQLNATLFNAAVRIAECLGLHRIEDTAEEDWATKAERETGKRVWCQVTIQDHFAIPFTESYTISPGHVSTTFPSNADDHDLIDQPENVPTVSSYVRVLSKMASLMPEMLDGLGPAKNARPLQEQYMHILSIDRRMRETVKTFPSFFLRQDSEKEIHFPWLGVARKSLAITAAEKIIMIHRPFLFRSFQMPLYAFTRKTCTAAATTILREHEALVVADDLSIWTHTAFCITAAVILCFEIYHGSETDPTSADIHRVNVLATRSRLVTRTSDLLAQRGVVLIDSLLEQRQNNAIAAGASMVDFDYIAAALYPMNDGQAQKHGITANEATAADAGQSGDFLADHGYIDAGFDSWFNEMFLDTNIYFDS